MNTSTVVIIVGIVIVILGLLMKSGVKIGSLPGDIKVEKGNAQFYFPITTSIIVSIILTLVFLLVRYFQK